MSCQNDISIRVTQINGNNNFSINKGAMVKEKDYESFIKSYFDYQAKVDVEKQKVLQEQAKAQTIKHETVKLWLIAPTIIIIFVIIHITIGDWSSNEREKQKLTDETTVQIEKIKAEANKTK